MSGAFDYGDKNKSETSGKGGELPRHIQRMNAGTAPPEAKGSVMKNGKSMSDSGLPWGGDPAEKKKAYMSGEPKNKSTTEPLGQRGANSSKLPSDSNAAHAGYKPTIQSKHVSKSK
jgi:hypothetical protein